MYRRVIIALTLVALTVATVIGVAFGLGVARMNALAPAIIGLSIGLGQLAAAWLFVSSLGTFRPRLQLAYRILAAGLLLLGLAQLQLGLVGLLQLQDSPWVSSGVILIPYALSGVLLYSAMHIFARLLNVRLVSTSAWRLLLVVGVALTITTLMPHIRAAATPAAETFFDIYMGLVTWSTLFVLATGHIAWHIKDRLGPLYQGAMRRLAVSLFALSLSGLHEILYTTLSPSSQAWYTTTGASLLPLLVTSVLVLIAGAAFKTASVQAIAPTADPIAVVIATAQLASDQTQIQPILDEVRALTARLAPGSSLSGGDTSKAAALYSRLEDYLVTKEPLRGFSRESLRARLPESFEQLVTRPKAAA